MKAFAFLFLFFTFSVTSLSAQEFLWDFNSDTQGLYMPIIDFPDSELPKGADSVIFVYFQEEAVLGWAICKGEKVYLMKKFDQEEDIWFNWAKANYYGTYRNGLVEFCSQMPFRSTVSCDMFKWTGKTFDYKEAVMTDASAESIDRAEKLRDAGKPCEALEEYGDVMYPSSYLNEDRLYAGMLIECHTVALTYYQKKDYAAACATMGCILDDFWIDFEADYVEDGKWTGEEDFTRSKYIDIMGDYGLFLLRAKQYDKAIKINQELIAFAPEVVGPLLQLGDAQFQLGELEAAKKTYRQYHDRMLADGKAKKIPSRVSKRM